MLGRQRQLGKGNKKLAIRVALLVSIVLLGLFFRGPLAKGFAFFQRPLVGAGTWITAHTIGIFRPETISLDRVKTLEDQRNTLAVDYAELELLQKENEELRGLLSFVKKQRFVHVTASVIARSISAQSATFVIDQGTRDGIQVGAPVVVSGGIFIGTVTETGERTATVTATIDPRSAVAATLLNETKHLGIAEGVSGKLIALRLVPQEERVQVNNLVVTSGLEEEIPSGLVIGIITEVRSEVINPFQEAFLEPLADIRRHHTVSVITEKEAL